MTPAADGESPLWILAAQLGLLSLMAIGGGVLMLAPDVHRLVTLSHHWITDEQFAAAFTIGQAAPGPNMLYVTIIGWQIAGLAGAIVATLAIIVPTSTLTLLLLRFGTRDEAGPFGRALRAGIAPVSVGLLLAGGWILTRASEANWHGALLTLVAILAVTRTRINPVLLIAAGAVAGILGWV